MDDNGWYYCGHSSRRSVNATTGFTEATLLTLEEAKEVEDCLKMGFNLYSVVISKPALERQGVSADHIRGTTA